jgi:aminoglycoside phosphotransferase (APT) family kinase protein
LAVRDRAELQRFQQGLTAWLQQRPEVETVEISEVEMPESGRSNETVYCRARWRESDGTVIDQPLVIRLQAVTDGLYRRTDVLDQHRTLAAIRGRGVAVPEVLWASADAEALGRPFFAMARVAGRVLADVPSYHAAGWATELTPDQRRLLHDNALQALVALHRLDPAAGLEFLQRPGEGSALERHLGWVQEWFAWAARDRDLELLRAGMRYVVEQRPATEDSGIVWNDARVGNMIIAEDLSIAAILDFEVAGLGPAEIDLGWWLMFEEFLTDAQRTSRLPGFFDRAETIARYEELSGKAVEQIEYYEVLAALGFSLVMLRYADREVEAGRLGPETTMGVANPASQILARKLGLEVPELAPEFAAVAAASTSVDG